ncbi:MAG: hypothetical protein IJ458_01470 [Clostridia bacterium]|nr:hypothetical protein [Clostridia bacterium]
MRNELEKDKEKLVRYLYPTKEISGLMCNDIYQELLEIIPLECCICEDNIKDNVRTRNLVFVRGAIKGFVLGNIEYQKILFEYYHHDNLEWIVRDILIGFVLYISTISEKFKEIDILKDKQSILYGETFILDLM